MKKQRILSLLFIAILSSILWAQPNRLVLLGSPRILPNEFAGVKDINGKFCAGIVLISDKEGFTYDSNMGVVKVDDKPGKDIVYLSPQEQVLDIYLAGFTPLHLILNDIGITLHAREMWEVHIGAKVQSRLDSLPVAIYSAPPYDEIYIDGKRRENTPIQMLVPGTHRIRIKAAGFQTFRDTITVDKDHLRFTCKLQEQEYARLQVNSRPSGAAVYLDDVYVNTTPLETMYPIGAHLMRLEKNGYQKIEQLVQIKQPLTGKQFVLKKLRAFLRINTYDYARITIDGKRFPANTLLTFEPKLVTVNIYVAGMDSTQHTIPLAANTFQKIDFYPSFPAGEVRISTDPPNAQIALYDFNRQLVAQDTARLFIHNLPATTYTMRVTAPGFKEKRETIVVVPNRAAKRIVHLERTQPGSSAERAGSHKPWRSIVLLNTIPREPGNDIFRWTWNPAAIQKGAVIAGGAVYENYTLKHKSYPNFVYRRLKITNRTYRAGIFLGDGTFQLALNYANRIKQTAEIDKKIENSPVPLHSYKEVSEIFSLTLGFRLSFGLSLAARGNFQNVKFIDRVSGSEPWENSKVRTLDLGIEQKLGDVLFLDVFSNRVKEYVDNEEIRSAYTPKYVNASATLHLDNLWLTGGVRLTRSSSFKDSLLFLNAHLKVSRSLWLNSFYTQSRNYPIIDMDVNMVAPIVMIGGGMHFDLDGLILGYQATYLKFSRVSGALYQPQNGLTNILDRNHFRHEISVSLNL